jgi:hypothetical protein
MEELNLELALYLESDHYNKKEEALGELLRTGEITAEIMSQVILTEQSFEPSLSDHSLGQGPLIVPNGRSGKKIPRG